MNSFISPPFYHHNDRNRHPRNYANPGQFRGFGKFERRFRESRRVVNPQKGESLMMVLKFVPHFTPGTRFKEFVNS